MQLCRYTTKQAPTPIMAWSVGLDSEALEKLPRQQQAAMIRAFGKEKAFMMECITNVDLKTSCRALKPGLLPA